jgi:hypothetical protein
MILSELNKQKNFRTEEEKKEHVKNVGITYRAKNRLRENQAMQLVKFNPLTQAKIEELRVLVGYSHSVAERSKRAKLSGLETDDDGI